MDPDTCLDEIRDLYEAIIVLYDSDGSRNDEVIDKANELAGKINDLDVWFSHGGFPPKAWQSNTRD